MPDLTKKDDGKQVGWRAKAAAATTPGEAFEVALEVIRGTSYVYMNDVEVTRALTHVKDNLKSARDLNSKK